MRAILYSGPMAKGKATEVEQYLAKLPAGRRADIEATRKLIVKHLPKGYEETVSGNFLNYVVPLTRYPQTYNKQPLAYLSLAPQKNYNALYLMGCYISAAQQKRLAQAYRKAGRKLDMGKSCLRFQGYEELPHQVLGELIAETTPADFIAAYERSRSATR